MAQLLIVTPDLQASAEIETLASKIQVSTRVVSTLHAAKEWLSMQQFDALLVDAGPDALPALELIEFGWKHHPLLHAAVFSFRREVSEKWKIIAAGSQVFCGADAHNDIHRFLSVVAQLGRNSKSDHSTVLYVEDLDSPREIMAHYIQTLGYQNVVKASSADAALSILREHPNRYFCAVVDILMPETNGIVLTEKIRLDRTLSHLPIIVLTADPTASNLIECLKAGATGFLAKPPKKMALLRELEKAKRIVLFQQSPRLCTPEQAHLLEEAMTKQGIR